MAPPSRARSAVVKCFVKVPEPILPDCQVSAPRSARGLPFESHVSTLPSTAPDRTSEPMSATRPRLATRPIARLDRRGDAGRLPRAARTAPARVRAAPHARRSPGGRATRLAKRWPPGPRASTSSAIPSGRRPGCAHRVVARARVGRAERVDPRALLALGRGRAAGRRVRVARPARAGRTHRLHRRAPGPARRRRRSSGARDPPSTACCGARGSGSSRAYADAATEPPEGPIASHVQSLARRAMG